ncbi:MAG: D-tyrosyl-tRNA(Tyr) deacylase [Chlorobiales bacterium]|nr:D-tyrosyl-tRNA(Tyr) deacylase [Chlorobiales bacterium]
MRVLVQRVSKASVTVDGATIGQIKQGLLLLIGFTHTDAEKDIEWMTKKVLKLRIFRDSEDKMNLSVEDVGGGILAISQFTLYGDAAKGNRPSFINASRPEQAEQLYEKFVGLLKAAGTVPVETGLFAADMNVELINQGPITIMLDSEIKTKDN